MDPSQIPAFVDEVIAAGCDISAVGDEFYIIGDADRSDEEYEKVAPVLSEIEERYGARGHLRFQIVAHLRSIGRFVDPDDVYALQNLH